MKNENTVVSFCVVILQVGTLLCMLCQYPSVFWITEATQKYLFCEKKL